MMPLENVNVPELFAPVEVWLTPTLRARDGLLMRMLTLPSALKAATAPAYPTPDDVGRLGSVLFEPLQRLRFH